MTNEQKERLVNKLHKKMTFGETFKCSLCGNELKAIDPVEYIDGRWMHTKCDNKEFRNRRN